MNLPAPPQPAPPATKVQAPVALIGLGGVLVLIGSFMPWASITSIFGTISVTGTNGDGKITLFCGIALLLLAVLEWTKPGRRGLLAIIPAGVAAVIALMDIANVSSRVAEASSDMVLASVGAGLYVVAAGAALGIAGGFMSR